MPKSDTAECSDVPGARQPGNLVNSAYFLLPGGRLCCPNQRCQHSDEKIRVICGSRGIVNEPCSRCKTCVKIKGEACHGVLVKI